MKFQTRKNYGDRRSVLAKGWHSGGGGLTAKGHEEVFWGWKCFISGVGKFLSLKDQIWDALLSRSKEHDLQKDVKV